MEQIGKANLGTVSSQVVAEFVSVVTGKKMVRKLSIEQASLQVETLLSFFHVVQVTPTILLEALRGAKNYQLHWWDALIWSTAKASQITTIFTEDFSEGQVIEGIHIVNPFSNDFKLEDWIERTE